ncbi:DegT/DnrJ/EryC1/StrS family aminotransferase [Mesorhizobium sp. M4B.F.Ca.ET.215.01.1.1]|uniref:DegT/DnrJ/EryC1/StrS family aminotransferase n=1 Tax=Mesorhizobium abyssinicae TaxID=1209958 RepID=A0ABU5ANX9_9HYPH|nr:MULTISPECIES: DegT/DnrJ/EryC1/StrS family aminotransferase [Mesorhizobium]MDX8538994.1 DegT/DnrJ/EryC1/StrS family aminotransferase [Mesorhizobium abyssinicae]RUW24179.1 DegT/DnrJ/EryC1/StrS family aminotransferase [Mesorhizobium sp. M4B.F.Ca.ET.013.02.1.1]RUW71417.1 DegT/DnrJ/EryC1/StrS family aminotransferase [Mesorhizobium sp. M4B.F.Ca.ET.049.02.1.2]RVD44314.1 DegT/DnrJ/EryC1/StrS family aminotransferase [Mesorhizobium sp. M4B.F.Ca.ET.019.03.1.1]RWX66195.1 DegT/DnrJ/EryC1/StrS family ami
MTKPNAVPMNDLKRLYQRYEVKIDREVASTLRSGWWLNGSTGRRFAANFAEFVGVSDCVLVANGTDALELALASVARLGDTRGREVIMTANAGGYASCACWHNDLIPHYVDIEPASQLVSVQSVQEAVCADTAAIVVTHLYGGVVDVRAIRAGLALAGLSHIPIVEDCAQAHGARIGGNMAGSLGDIATFSFYPTKNLGAMGDGGAVLTSDPALAGQVRQLQQYGWTSKYHVGIPGGRNSRMDEVQAAILDVLLPDVDNRNEQRRAILDRYKSVARRRVKFLNGGDGAVAHLAVALCDDRDAFRAFMKERGVDTEIHYPVLDCDQVGWADLPMKGIENLPVSRASVGRLCSVPCYPDMTNNEIEQVCLALGEWEAM